MSLRLIEDSPLSRLEQMKIGNHIIGIYSDVSSALDEAFPFLKKGLDKGEAVMLITQAMTKEQILDRMTMEWNVDARSLEAASDIIIKTTKEWYFPEGPPDSNRIIAMWNAVVGLSVLRRKKGLRVFGEAAAFFKNGFGRNLVEYECSLDPQFDIPLTALCAYTVEDISSLGAETIDRLQERHVKTWA
jgi:hypothetical protein